MYVLLPVRVSTEAVIPGMDSSGAAIVPEGSVPSDVDQAKAVACTVCDGIGTVPHGFSLESPVDSLAVYGRSDQGPGRHRPAGYSWRMFPDTTGSISSGLPMR